MKKFKNKLLILTAIASLFGLCGNIQTHAMKINNNSIEEKNDFLCKKRNKDNTEYSKNDNYFHNKFPFNNNLNNSFDYEKSDELKPDKFTEYSKNNNYFHNKFPFNNNLNNNFYDKKSDEFKPDELKPDKFTEYSKNNNYFYNKFPVNNNSANNEQNENVSNNENIIPTDEYNSLKKNLEEIIKECKRFFKVFENGKLKGKLIYSYSTICIYIKKMRDKTLPIIEKKYPNIANQIFDKILIEAIREKHKDDDDYIFNFTIQNDNGSYVGVTQNDKDKIQNVISHLTGVIETLGQSSISHCKNAVKYLLMADTKIQKSNNKTDYLDEYTAEKFVDFLLDKIKNVSNNKNIISPDEYNSLKKDFYGIIKKYKDYFQVCKKGEPRYSYSTIYRCINEMRKAALLINEEKYFINISTATQIFDKILIEAIREEHKDDDDYIFNFTIQNDNRSYVGVTQNDKNKIQNVISTLTKAIETLSRFSISQCKNAIKYLLMADTKIQKSDNKTDYLNEDTAVKFAKQLIKKAKTNIK